MAHVTIADLFEEITVDLWGVTYEVLQSSEAVEEKLSAASADLTNFRRQNVEDVGEDDDPEYDPEREKKGRELLAAAVDSVLKPVENGDGNKPPRAKTHLLALYRQKKIGTAQFDVAFEQVMELFGRRNRPTTASPGESES